MCVLCLFCYVISQIFLTDQMPCPLFQQSEKPNKIERGIGGGGGEEGVLKG